MSGEKTESSQKALSRRRMQEGCAYLQRGRFDLGWELYDERFVADGRVRDLPQPLWQGEPLEGKSILIHREQGLGDEILYASCFREVVDRASKVFVTCDERLGPMLRRTLPEAEILPAKTLTKDWRKWKTLEVDYQIPAGSLPRYLRPHITCFPSTSGFLVEDPLQVQEWRERLPAMGPGLKVGVSWQGGIDLESLRRAPWELWLPLLEREQTTFVSLQYGDNRDTLTDLHQQTGLRIHWLDRLDTMNDIEGLAGLLKALDIVITVPNTTVHLAGSLGVAVWVVFDRPWGCSWIVNGSVTPWYRTATVFARTGSWESLGTDLSRRLDGLDNRSKQPSLPERESPSLGAPSPDEPHLVDHPLTSLAKDPNPWMQRLPSQGAVRSFRLRAGWIQTHLWIPLTADFATSFEAFGLYSRAKYRDLESPETLNELWSRDLSSRSEALLEDVFLLGGTANYFHFVIDFLPRMVALRARKERSTTIVIAEELPDDYRRILKRVAKHQGLDRVELVPVPRGIFPVADAILPAVVPRKAAIRLWGRHELLPPPERSTRTDERIFVRRDLVSKRRLLGQDELCGHLERDGFHCVDPGTLSFEEQRRLFSEARLVCGVHGSGLTNVLFAPSSCRVVELGGGPRQPFFPDLCRSKGQAYAFVKGRGAASHDGDFAVSYDDVAPVLERLDLSVEAPS